MIVLKNIKKMSKIPTTEEYFKEYSDNVSLAEGYYDYLVEKDSFKEAMIKFAKLHVEEALKEANNANLAELGHCYECGGAKYIDEQSVILIAYSLENIK